MGLSNRLKERREQLGLTQSEVASLLGITPSAVGNYENGVSTPKADILFKVFDALKCDANYLFQDEMTSRLQEDNATPFEMEHLVKKYRALDKNGRDIIDFTLEKEYTRCTDYVFIDDNGVPHLIETSKLNQQEQDLRLKSYVEHLTPNAAHADADASEEDIQHDNDIMDDENF